MKNLLKHTARFAFFVVIQTMILNQFELGLGIHPMIYPLFIVLLPFEFKIIPSMLLAFTMGILIDIMSNTYGLHTSSLVLIAYLRPIIYKAFSQRDGYDPIKEGSIYEMGHVWFLYVFGILLIIHHLWFFAIEMFKLNEIGYILRKTILSAIVSYLFCVLFQMLFIKKAATK
jgi:rod shape-determining protein MreD